MSIMEENTILRQHKLSGAKSKHQSNYESDILVRRNIKRSVDNLKPHSNQSLVDQQHIAQNAGTKLIEEHNIINRKQTHIFSKKYLDTIDQTQSLCRNLKIACYENISIKSKVTNKTENTSLDHRKIKRHMNTYSKNYNRDKVPINKCKAIFYKDLCISGKNMSMWKRIKYRFRSLTSAKIRSDIYIVSTDLSSTLSTCDDKKSNNFSSHLKTKNNLEETNDTPYSKKYITMHLKLEKSNTQQELVNNNIEDFSKLKRTPRTTLDDMKLPVVDFPESYIHDYKKSLKAILKPKITEITKQILAKLLDEWHTQCDEINTNSYKTISTENINICERESKCVAADTDCKDKCIPNHNEPEVSSKLSIFERRSQTTSLQSTDKNLSNVKTTTYGLVTNKSRQSQVPQGKQVSKNNQGIFIKCKCAKTMGKVKCSNVNTTTFDKKSKSRGSVKKHAKCKCAKTQCFAPSKDYTNQFGKEPHGKSYGSQYTKLDYKQSKQTKSCKAVKRKSNENLSCSNNLCEKKLYLDEKGKSLCKCTKKQILSPAKHNMNRLINQNNIHNPCECKKNHPNPNIKLSKQSIFHKVFKLKPTVKLSSRHNQDKFILIKNHSRNQSPFLSKHDKYLLTRRKSCSSYDSKQVKKHCKHRETHGKFTMKNTYSPSKNIKSDMDIRRKGPNNPHDCCTRSCRCARNDLNSYSTQHGLNLKRRIISAFETQVGDGTNNLRCHFRSDSSNSQMSNGQQSTFNSGNLLTERPQNGVKWSSKRHLLHDRKLSTISKGQYCKSCFTSLISNANSQPKTLKLRVQPRICTCTKNLNKTLNHKTKTKCANIECQKKTQTGQRTTLVAFFENFINWDNFKRRKHKKSTKRKNTYQVDFNRSKLYEYAFGHGSYPAIDCMCPLFSPNTSKRASPWQQFTTILFLSCLFCYWCPLLFLFRMCRWFFE